MGPSGWERKLSEKRFDRVASPCLDSAGLVLVLPSRAWPQIPRPASGGPHIRNQPLGTGIELRHLPWPSSGERGLSFIMCLEASGPALLGDTSSSCGSRSWRSPRWLCTGSRTQAGTWQGSRVPPSRARPLLGLLGLPPLGKWAGGALPPSPRGPPTLPSLRTQSPERGLAVGVPSRCEWAQPPARGAQLRAGVTRGHWSWAAAPSGLEVAWLGLSPRLPSREMTGAGPGARRSHAAVGAPGLATQRDGRQGGGPGAPCRVACGSHQGPAQEEHSHHSKRHAGPAPGASLWVPLSSASSPLSSWGWRRSGPGTRLLRLSWGSPGGLVLGRPVGRAVLRGRGLGPA